LNAFKAVSPVDHYLSWFWFPGLLLLPLLKSLKRNFEQGMMQPIIFYPIGIIQSPYQSIEDMPIQGTLDCQTLYG
jgi:hypothetical protein